VARDAHGECQYITRPGNLWPVAGVIALGAAAGVVVLVRFVLGDSAPVQGPPESVGLGGRF
jgi:hypothetical protein